MVPGLMPEVLSSSKIFLAGKMAGKPHLEIRARMGRFLRNVLATPMSRLFRAQIREQQDLDAYRGLVHQAFYAEPFRPWVCTDVLMGGQWHAAGALPPTKSPARRERDNAVHHYGHDVILKRAAALPLVGQPLPFLLEHGVNFSDQAGFEVPKPWVRSYLCMGEQRAARIRRLYGVDAVAVGPYIQYAHSLLSEQRGSALKEQLGRSLLVIPAHSVDQVQRSWSDEALIGLVERHRRQQGFDTVIWQGFWKDEPPSNLLPPGWILAGNGHRSNPWFLDCQRTLLELCDAMLTFALGTHVGYALALQRRVLFAGLELKQDVSGAEEEWKERYLEEARERQRLIKELGVDLARGGLTLLDSVQAKAVLDPWFGFDRELSPQALRAALGATSAHERKRSPVGASPA